MKHRVSSAGKEVKHYWFPLAGILVLCVIVVTAAVVAYLPRQTAHAATGDWPTFLGNNARTGFNAAETVINPTTAPGLKNQRTCEQ